MDTKSKPLYTYFVVGYPDAPYEYFHQVAKELGINLRIKYHGCLISTLYKDESVTITDASVEALRIEMENEAAAKYYNQEYGNDWLKKVRERASQLYDESDEADLPF